VGSGIQSMLFSLEPIGISKELLFLIEHSTITLNGDVESAFLEKTRLVSQHSSETRLGTILDHLRTHGAEVIVVIRNGALVLDKHLFARIEETLSLLEKFNKRWALAGAGGLSPTGVRYCSMYSSAEPFLPMGSTVRPIVDIFPDLYLINVSYLAHLPTEHLRELDVALETFAVSNGYVNGWISLYVPTLSAGINGHFLRRDYNRFSVELQEKLNGILPGAHIDTLTGVIPVPDFSSEGGANHRLPRKRNRTEINLRRATRETILSHCDDLRISVVTRTRFQRPHLLTRMLTSIVRALDQHVDLEIVLATDVDDASSTKEAHELKGLFPDLAIKVVRSGSPAHSRVANLLAGIAGAAKEYVLILDDDDYLDATAFSNIRPALFQGARPIIISDSEVHQEHWIQTGQNRYVLEQTKRIRVHGHLDWRKTFAGVNMVPICGAVFVRDVLASRLEGLMLRYDLSEDYAVSLAALTDPALPEIYELPATVAHISVRAKENTITLEDRRGWTHDIAGFVHDLTRSSLASPGIWEVLTRQTNGVESDAKDVIIAELREQIGNKARQIAQLRNQVVHLLSERNRELKHGEIRQVQSEKRKKANRNRRVREIGEVS